MQQNQVERLAHVLGCSEIPGDPRFATPDARLANDAALQQVLSARFATRSAEEWERVLSVAGVPAGKVRRLDEALSLEQLADRGLFLDVPTAHPGLSQARILNAGFRFAHDGPGHAGPAPVLGQHTDEVLREVGAAPMPHAGRT